MLLGEIKLEGVDWLGFESRDLRSCAGEVWEDWIGMRARDGGVS